MSFVRDAFFICAMYAITSALPALSAIAAIAVASITTVYDVDLETRLIAVIGTIAVAQTITTALNMA